MLLLIELRAPEATFFGGRWHGRPEKDRVIGRNLSKMRARPTLNFAYAHLVRIALIISRETETSRTCYVIGHPLLVPKPTVPRSKIRDATDKLGKIITINQYT